MDQSSGKVLANLKNLKISTNQEFLQPNQIRLYEDPSDFERKYYVITINEGADIPANSTISNLALHLQKELHEHLGGYHFSPERVEELIWQFLGGVKCEQA